MTHPKTVNEGNVLRLFFDSDPVSMIAVAWRALDDHIADTSFKEACNHAARLRSTRQDIAGANSFGPRILQRP